LPSGESVKFAGTGIPEGKIRKISKAMDSKLTYRSFKKGCRRGNAKKIKVNPAMNETGCPDCFSI
jgi:hypothetical protein